MSEEVMVTTLQGMLRGRIEETSKGFTFYSFMGIPYAKPPIDKLKFKAPQPPESWEGIRDAYQEGNVCLSKNPFLDQIEGDFDCLYLNVFTPQLASNKPKAVMVWIHGGAFTMGSKNRDIFDPAYLIDKGIVLVTINYRLGALGFLNLKDDSLGVSGNAGLKDQVMALRWVQQNIKTFGGDPQNVTIFGESAGAASVSYQLLSPMSKGLFHKAILQSGLATCQWAQGRENCALELLKAMGKSSASVAEADMLEIFENASSKELMEAQLKVPDFWKAPFQRYFCPTVETSISEERFLTDTPEILIKIGSYHKVPVILGHTSNEGLFISFVELSTKIDATPFNADEFVPYTLNSHDFEQTKSIGTKIKRFYYGDDEPNPENRQCFFNFASDIYFNRRIMQLTDQLVNAGQTVYLYKFCYDTNLNVLKKMFGVDKYVGASHGDDIMYLFKSGMVQPFADSSVEGIGIQRMALWWTNFAKYSNPNGTSTHQHPLLDVVWPIATEDREFMNIDQELSVGKQLGDRMNQFWKAIEAECAE